MAAYLNRGVSMISGNGYDSSLVDPNSRQIHNVNSPLQIFVKAKKNINDIFGDISDYVVETTSFIEGKLFIILNIILLKINFFPGLAVESSQSDIVDKAETEAFRGFVFKINNIREVLARDHMKVAFFGRTSNGKSSVINAMLREKILPR
jgi:mitofusin